MKTKLALIVAIALFVGGLNANAQEKTLGKVWFGYSSDVNGLYTVKMFLEDESKKLYRVIFWKTDNTRGSNAALRLEGHEDGNVTFTNLNSGRKFKGSISKEGDMLIHRYNPEKTKMFIRVIKGE